MKIKRLLFMIIGCISLSLGCVGIVLPFLPTVPFFLATVFCFSQSSQKLHNWFISTKMYKKHLKFYINKKGMTVRTKITVIVSITLLMGIGYLIMSHVPTGRIVLAIVWIGHILYFVFGVRTIRNQADTDTIQ